MQLIGLVNLNCNAKLLLAGITDENGMYTMRLRPAEGQNLFITVKKEGYAPLTPSIMYDMAEGESQNIMLSLSPELGVRWRNCRRRKDDTFNQSNLSQKPPEW